MDQRDGMYQMEVVNKRHNFQDENQSNNSQKRIGSGRREYLKHLQEPPIENQTTDAPPQKYYQTFNEDEHSIQNEQCIDQQEYQMDHHPQMGDEEDSELSEYPGEGEDLMEEMEGDFGETGQISPTQTSPEKESDFENNRSENLRNFMNQAQPAGIINEQIDV